MASAEGTKAEMHVVRTRDGHSLHAEVAGEGPTVLLIQGLGYAKWAWPATCPRSRSAFA